MPTTISITPFLTFEHQAEQAAKLYTAIFGGKIIDVTHYGDGAPRPKGSVMTVTFELLGQRYVALNGGPYFKFSEGFSLSVNCATQAEIDNYWGKLADGGEEGPCGWLKDRFGLSWQVVPANIGELLSKPAAMQAMMTMKKLIIADLVAAH
ncbi:MAG: VOC family protein [Deltaproteobacteria bacterium]|nr:VOC family protein [Deltaproteobacteria bacterium]MCW5803204.1 VOC family protein [Deltaproteobacteria bacterium]